MTTHQVPYPQATIALCGAPVHRYAEQPPFRGAVGAPKFTTDSATVTCPACKEKLKR